MMSVIPIPTRRPREDQKWTINDLFEMRASIETQVRNVQAESRLSNSPDEFPVAKSDETGLFWLSGWIKLPR
jgi:hypothetical protein